MGFQLERAGGRSAAIKAAKKHGAPATVNLEELLEQTPASRARWLRERSDRNLTGKAAKAVRDAATLDELHAALDNVIDRDATPDLVRRDDLILQPSEERRRSGSHYTPRSLTGPIVRDTLEPILDRLRRGCPHGSVTPGNAGAPPASGESPVPAPRPEQILDLCICDPAMGSGAFLVEACRQLGDALVESWRYHDATPNIPPASDETVHARRLIARNCLYGVDRNPVAVDLAKLSLWLATLAKDHPLTFLDHAFRHGDSLVGLTLEQIQAFHWKGGQKRFQAGIETTWIREQVEKALRLRREIQDAGEETPDKELRQRLREADSELARVKTHGDLALAAFFEGKKPKEREELRREFAQALQSAPGDDASPSGAHAYAGWLDELRKAPPPLAPFHWEIEFPEVLLPQERENPGFDGVVGNPPFQGGRNLTASKGPSYSKWLLLSHSKSSGGADLVAHFFRRSFDLLRERGVFGLIATNTIAQGDTRATGLRQICQSSGEIYRARRRIPWPGLAAVIVSVVHVHRGAWVGPRLLDDLAAPTITAFLFHRGGHEDPARLAENAGKSFQGSIVLGMGFTFDDSDKRAVATPLAEMRRLIELEPRNAERVLPYIGGAEVNRSPTHAHHRYAINFGELPLRRDPSLPPWPRMNEQERAACLGRGVVPKDYRDAVAADWPDLLGIVEEKVKPERITKDAKKYPRMVNEWWKYWNSRPELYAAISDLDRVIAISRVGQHAAFTWLPAGMVFSEQLILFPLPTHATFCALQSRPHELWARFFGSSMKDDLRYTPSDCFETFPFPEDWETHPDLEAAGRTYHDYRAALMIENGEGLTTTYNRFHDPHESSPAIQKLRDLHAAMDRSVLAAYGWTDIPTDCEFLLDYEIDEEAWGNKKKPYRYRWPNEVRHEVLARLLELNAQRAAEERRGGLK